MRPADLDGHRCEPRYSPAEARFRGLRSRLQGVANSAGANGNVYINGERISTADLQFVLDNFQCPKPK